MALRLSCTMCGANIKADDFALRREFVTCTHCSTVLRITQLGTQEYRDSIPQCQAPPGVVIERKAPGHLSITAPRTPHIYVLPKESTRRALLTGLAIGIPLSLVISLLALFAIIVVVLSESPWHFTWFFIVLIILFFFILPAVLVIIASVAVTYYIMAGLSKNLSPLRLDNGVIHSSYHKQSITGKDVRQIYTAVTTGAIPGIGVFALTKDDKRIRLVWPLISKEVALYIEELLEVELGIFNLPVYGDPDIPGQEGDAIPESPALASVEGIQCEGCAVLLHETPEERRQGYVICKYCNGVTLIYEPGTSKPILGLPKLNSPTFQYRLVETLTGLAVSDCDTKNLVLEISGGELYLYRGQRREYTISIPSLANLSVKAKIMESAPAPTTTIGGLKRFWQLAKTMDEAGKYSGEVDVLEVMKQVGGLKTFSVVTRNTRGDEIELLEGIKDPREAFVLARSLSKVCLHQANA